MDVHETIVKKEKIEDNNDNYLPMDIEIDVNIENNSDVDWNIENFDRNITYEDYKQEFELQRIYTCPICYSMFLDSTSLYEHNLKHLQVVLNEPRWYQCDYCLCFVKSKKKIRTHIQANHFLELRNHKVPINEKVHECLICNKMFTYNNWHGHMSEVHSTTKYQCEICDIMFKCKKYLRRHTLYKHQNIKPSWRFHTVSVEHCEVKCDLCPKVFHNRSSCRTHIRNCHSNEVFECTVCHSKLKSKTYLLTHIRRVHYDDGNTYKCNICGKEFRSPRYLNIHKKNTHYKR